MPKDKLIKTLEELGLSEKEAQIYIAALSLGPTTVAKLANATDVKRPTVYPVIESLKKKGLMSVEMKGFKKLFVPESPDRLEQLLSLRRESLAQAMPEFSALYNLKGGSGILKHYEGLEAVKNVYESMLRDVRPGEDYLVLSDQEKWLALDREFFLDFRARRAKLPINTKLLLQYSEPAKEAFEYAKTGNMENAEVRFLPKKTKLTTNLVVIPRRVMIHQLVPPVTAVVMESPSIIQMHQEMFGIMWAALE